MNDINCAVLESYLFFLKTRLKIRQPIAKTIPAQASTVYTANKAGWIKFSSAARGVPSVRNVHRLEYDNGAQHCNIKLMKCTCLEVETPSPSSPLPHKQVFHLLD